VPDNGVTALPLAAAPTPTATPTIGLPPDLPPLIESPSAPAAAVLAARPNVEPIPLDALVETASAAAVVVQPDACPSLDPVPAVPPARPAPSPTVMPVPAIRGPDEQVHRARLRHSMTARARRRPAERRDPAWQQGQRQCERVVRVEAATLASAWQDQGVLVREIAHLLDCPARTLRHWQHELAADRLPASPLGRPQLHCTAEESQEVIRFLHGHGPWVGMPTLTGQFGGLPAADLRDLLRIFRHVWIDQHPRETNVLHWHQVGTVWAMDFTKVRHPVDDIYPYVFAVRDLASGQQLAWQPVLDMEAATAHAELQFLFTIHGAPLVVKSDNGSAFRAASMKSKLAPWQVWPLYSPPGQPGYNGAIEASIGSLKKRTQHAAYLAGHAGEWTTADLDRARTLANLVARPRGADGPTPQQLWESRRTPTLAERAAIGVAVRRLEQRLRDQDGIAPDLALDHYEQAALHRRVLQQVLVERSLLTITRRRIPQTFYGQKVANIT
jgi:transposase InsO family protein